MYPIALLSTLALGADHPQPSPARLCADAALGTEVEVCLRLAITYPDAIDEITAALVAHQDRAAAPDRHLLEALLVLAGSGGAIGARRLAELGDPRGIGFLVQAMYRREPTVAVASARALVAWSDVWPLLGTALTDDALPDSVRVAAAEALVRTADPRALDLVEEALLEPGVSRNVHRQVAGALAERFPSRPAPDRGLTSEAAAWLAVGAGVGLAYAMGTVAAYGPAELWPVGVITGGSAGVAFGWVYGRAWPMDPGDGALITLSGLAVGGVGASIGAGLTPDHPEGALAGGLAGELVGFTAATALRKSYPGTARDVLEASALGGLAFLATDGIARSTGADRSRPWLDAAALATGYGVGLAFAPRWQISRQDVGLVATGATVGLATALLAPIPLPDPADRWPLWVAGPAIGAATSMALADIVEVPGKVWATGLTGGAAGAAVGGGIGRLTSDDARFAGALALATGAAGLGIGAAVAVTDPDPIDDRDVVLVAATTGWAAAQAAAVAYADDARIDDRDAGWILLTSGLVGAGTASLNLQLDVPVPLTLTASSVGLWGAYTGGTLGEIFWSSPEIPGLIGANIGLIGGGILVSDWVGTPLLVVAMANAGGVVGASAGGLAVGLSGDPNAALGASLAGGTLGAVAGGVLGRRWHRSGGRRDIAWIPRIPGRWTLMPEPGRVTLVIDQW